MEDRVLIDQSELDRRLAEARAEGRAEARRVPTGAASNEAAIELLTEFAEACANAVRIATWAEAFLTYGGEATWDAVKAVADVAVTVQHLGAQVELFRADFDAISPF